MDLGGEMRLLQLPLSGIFYTMRRFNIFKEVLGGIVFFNITFLNFLQLFQEIVEPGSASECKFKLLKVNNFIGFV